MKYLKLFESFNDEPLVKQYSGFSGGPVWHVSPVKIDDLAGGRPIWFALEYDHSLKGWYENTIDNTGRAYLYEARVSGKIAIQGDPNVEKLFEAKGLDLEADYVVEVLVQNPSSEEVLEADGTQILREAGYSGLIYFDYDPRDWSNDLEALILFNSSDIVDWSLKLTNSDEAH